MEATNDSRRGIRDTTRHTPGSTADAASRPPRLEPSPANQQQTDLRHGVEAQATEEQHVDCTPEIHGIHGIHETQGTHGTDDVHAAADNAAGWAIQLRPPSLPLPPSSDIEAVTTDILASSTPPSPVQSQQPPVNSLGDADTREFPSSSLSVTSQHDHLTETPCCAPQPQQAPRPSHSRDDGDNRGNTGGHRPASSGHRDRAGSTPGSPPFDSGQNPPRPVPPADLSAEELLSPANCRAAATLLPDFPVADIARLVALGRSEIIRLAALSPTPSPVPPLPRTPSPVPTICSSVSTKKAKATEKAKATTVKTTTQSPNNPVINTDHSTSTSASAFRSASSPNRDPSFQSSTPASSTSSPSSIDDAQQRTCPDQDHRSQNERNLKQCYTPTGSRPGSPLSDGAASAQVTSLGSAWEDTTDDDVSVTEEELIEQGVPALTRIFGALQIEADLSQYPESFDSDCSEEDLEQLSLSQTVGNDDANHSSETNSRVVIGDQESIGDAEDNHDMGSDEVQQPTKQEFIDNSYDWPDKELDVKPQNPNATKDRNRKKAGDSAKRKRGDLTDTDSDAPCCSLDKFQRIKDSTMQARVKSNRMEINMVRKGKACLRCRNQRLKCASDPENPTRSCKNCQSNSWSTWKKRHRIICLQSKVSEVILYRRGGLNLTRRWKDVGMHDIEDRVGNGYRVIHVSQGLCEAPIVLNVVQFKPKKGDVIARHWTCYEEGKEPVRKSKELACYCLLDINATAAAVEEYTVSNAFSAMLKRILEPVLEAAAMDPTPPVGLIELTYWRAMCEFVRLCKIPTGDRLPEDQMAIRLLGNTFILWLAIQHTTGSSYITGDDKLGMELETHDPTYPLQGKISIPRMIVAQFDNLNYTQVLEKYKKKVMTELRYFMNRSNTQWFVVYLVLFILMQQASSTAADRSRHARANFGTSIRYSIPDFVENLQEGCNSLLAHWHWYAKGVWNRSTRIDSKGEARIGDMTVAQTKIIQAAKSDPEIIKQHEFWKRWRRENGNISMMGDRRPAEDEYQGSQNQLDWEHPYYWIAQLLETKWSPHQTYQREPVPTVAT